MGNFELEIEELKKKKQTKITNLRIDIEVLSEFEKSCLLLNVKKNKAIEWLMAKFTEQVTK